MTRLRSLALLSLVSLGLLSPSRQATAQTDSNPVVWSAKLAPADARVGEGARILVTGVIKAPWYIYAPTTKGGPIPTKITFASSDAKWTGKVVQPKPIKKQDPGFGTEVQVYEKKVTFSLPVTLDKDSSGKATVSVKFQTCNHRMCLPPKTVQVPVSWKLKPGSARGNRLKPDITVPASVGIPPGGEESGGRTAIVQAGQGQRDTSLLPFLALAFVSGFASLLTPCVFPMIPITVSLFAKRQEGGASRLTGPLVYCAGITGTFTLLGILTALFVKATSVPNLAAHPAFNLAMGAVFIAMGLNLLGVYEIIIPPAIANKVQPRGKHGLMLPLLMGVASTITSFTCTAPFVGTTLVSGASSGALRPALGMFVYSLPFALTFFLLALFPTLLSKMPRAGEWLVSVKATMGFVELAAALKFLQQADFTLQLGWITRPLFLSLWFALALLTALYLLRWIRLPHDSVSTPVGPTRRVLGVGFGGIAAVLLAANNGFDLRDFESYLPPAEYGQRFAEPTVWLKDDYGSAVKRAQDENKPVLINFTGYACTNCRLMEKDVLPAKSVTAELGNFVPVFLHTDGTDAKSKVNSELQQRILNTVAIPVYAVVTPDGKLRGRLDGLERDPEKFAEFLKQTRETVRVASR